MPSSLLLLRDVCVTFSATPLLSGAALSVAAGDRICLVGRNGSGKSMLLRIAAGIVEPDIGDRFVQPGTRISYLPQEPDLSGFATTLAYVEAGFEVEATDRHRALYLLKELGLTGAEELAALSGGEARRVALARALAPLPDILLLDEPTNHLDLPGIEWLERELTTLRAGIVLISHDRRLLERLSRRTVWLDRGATHTLDEGFAAFEAWRDSILDQEDSEQHKLGRKIAMEEDWLRYGVTARRTRNERRLAELHALRRQRKEHRPAIGSVRLEAAQADLSGRLVAESAGISKSYDDRLIVRDFSTRIMRGHRVGIIGPNGAGKTTLLNMLVGVLPPDRGEVKLGTKLAAVILDQRRETLDPEQTLASALTGGTGDTINVAGQSRHVVGYMKDFLFRPEQARTSVGTLSGGERARLILARAFARPSNLLALDEPTNDLDMETLDLLQERLAEYPGTVLLVSHDRDFLDRVVTSVIASEGKGRWVEYAGGYSDMLVQRPASPAASLARSDRGPRQTARPVAPAAPRPRRMSYSDQRALETLPARIESLQARVEALNDELADPRLYAQDPERFAAKTAALAAAHDELTAAEDQWLTLELRREEIEGV
ncbi:MAG: ATP-binding cassette domain-containing protein [Alphaproteobacteria bacterium]|nr:ATP-binding cassette domain-containing protein [Alphaproteobacteria bacterium]